MLAIIINSSVYAIKEQCSLRGTCHMCLLNPPPPSQGSVIDAPPPFKGQATALPTLGMLGLGPKCALFVQEEEEEGEGEL